MVNESITYIKNLPISPKKLRFFLDSIKKYSPSEVLDYLYYSRQKAGKIFYQAIKSAVSNAKSTLKVPENLLKFKLLTVEEGLKLKRYQPGGRGMAKPYLKRKSHIKIILTIDKNSTEKDQVKKIKKFEKEEVLKIKPKKITKKDNKENVKKLRNKK